MIEICATAQLDEASAKSFDVGENTYFLVRHQGTAYGYLNQCPHLGVELNWKPDHFLDVDKRHIQCSTHGALFRMQDGFCIEGPCAGQVLTPVHIVESDGKLFLKQD